MPGIGTICNMLAIVLGGVIGMVGKRVIPDRLQSTLMKSTGLCVLFIGLSGTLEKMLHIADGGLASQGTMVLLGSFTLGTLVGEGVNIEGWIEKFGQWLKTKSGSQEDDSFLNGFLTASFTVCIGAMAIVGAFQDGFGDPSTLFLKSVLDFLIILVMVASLGKGCLFAAIPVGIWQGVLTLLARFLEPYMTELVRNDISMVGSVLIFCVGLNLVRTEQLRVANMLPAVVFAAVFGLFGL